MGDVVRQFNLYREYHKATGWVLVTGGPITAPELAELADAQITHMRLGRAFHRWASLQRQLPPDMSSPEL